MLTGAVCGNIYASPSSQAMLSAILATKSSNVILIVKNYTGDRLNFGLAAELAQNQYNVNVKTVLVGDDVTQTKKQTITGRRGLAGVVLVEKIVGAAAEDNLNINELYELGEAVSKSVVTIGVASSTCNIPGSAKKPPIPSGKLELGIGIHGEPGRELIANVDMNTTVHTMIDTILSNDSDSNYAQEIVSKINGTPNVVIMVNNTQGLTAPELGIATKSAYEYLTKKCKYNVVRVYADVFLSSLDMRGFSISILYVTDNKWLSYLDATCRAPAWPNCCSTDQWDNRVSQYVPLPHLKVNNQPNTTQSAHTDIIKKILTNVSNALIKSESEINELDSVAGDADAGSTFATGAKRLLKELDSLPFNDAAQVCYQLSDTVCQQMGGSSGAVIAILLLGASNSLKSNKPSSADAQSLVRAFHDGIQSVNKYSGSAPGGRSLLDAIVPALDAITKQGNTSLKSILSSAATAAENGCDATKSMRALVGRASYLPADKLKGVPDAGAKAIAVAFRAASDAVNQ